MLTIAEALEKFPDKSPQEIAALTGCTLMAVYKASARRKRPEHYAQVHRDYRTRVARANGVRPIKEVYWPDDDKAVLRQLWSTHSAIQIAAKLGRTKNAVIGMAHRMKLPSKKKSKGLQSYFDQYRRDMREIEERHA